MPTLVRLEYLTPRGWVVGHAGIALLDPQRYVDRLLAKEKFGRCIVLDESLQPTGEVFEPPALPDPADLRESETKIPALRVSQCSICGQPHGRAYECIL